MPISGRHNAKDVTAKSVECGSGLVQLGISRALVNVDGKADVSAGEYMTSAVVLFLAVMVGRRWCSKNGRRDGLSIDSSLKSLTVLFLYNVFLLAGCGMSFGIS